MAVVAPIITTVKQRRRAPGARHPTAGRLRQRRVGRHAVRAIVRHGMLAALAVALAPSASGVVAYAMARADA